MKKKLQVALDLFSSGEAFEVLDDVAPYVDIIELGTPLIVAEGARVVSEVKKRYPEKVVFADIKVMDGGGEVPKPVIEAGCDMFSVLCASDDATVRAAVDLARVSGVKVLADMCSVRNLEERAREITQFGPDYLCCHVGYDRQATGADPVEELRRLSCVKTPKAIAGGIKLETFEQALESDAEIIISGGGICQAANRGEVAQRMRSMLDDYNVRESE